MVQEVYVCFNKYFNKIYSYAQINQSNDVIIQEFLAYCMSYINNATYHTNKCNKCQYPNLTYISTYERNYIVFQDNKPVNYILKIPVFYCPNCLHYHALLPAMIISPYEPFSIAFILAVLNDRLKNKMTVQEILTKYNLSQSTYYRWIKRYKIYYRIFIMLKSKKSTTFFLMAEENFSEFSKTIFYFTGSALFEANFKLFSNST